MPKDNSNVQEIFLNYLRKSKQPITVFLTNGVKLQGVLTWFDSFCLTLTRDNVTQLVYKHSISTVMPTEKFNVYEVLGVDNIGNE